MVRKLFFSDVDFWCKLVNASKVSKKAKMRENCYFEGGINKGHSIQTRISWFKSSFGHSLTLVDNLKINI